MDGMSVLAIPDPTDALIAHAIIAATQEQARELDEARATLIANAVARSLDG